jgi:hypothetical protein
MTKINYIAGVLIAVAGLDRFKKGSTTIKLP